MSFLRSVCVGLLLVVFLLSAAPASALGMPGMVSRPGEQAALTYHYPERFEPAIAHLDGDADLLVAALERRLGLETMANIDVYLLHDMNTYFEWQGAEYRPSSWAVGLSLSDRSTVLVRHGVGSAGEPIDIKKTFVHELAHVAVDRARQGQHVPRWFNEGFAVLHAEEWTPERSDTLTRAASTGSVMPLASLDRYFPPHHQSVSLAYAQSFHFVRYLEQRFGDDLFAEMMARVREGVPFHQALEQASGHSLAALERQWRDELEEGVSFWAILGDANGLFFGATLFFLVAFGVRVVRRRRQARMLAEDDDPGAWDYDPALYPLPGQER
ncbi:hypothetical protein DL240_05240 [Lujinxingia litoralis]|uniref:Peptidase MA-like domain-containing protein n=1 Tax=Lujinxingia litoralis TaxID=2211119 RepID=A0A328C996_9DELT|nr:peptidase MA family metallohydrolase [Lujinxingia litoralis]RAL23564.1 hypothetical protein DL240_05240 [Lujinxingia litoralis]